MPVYEYACAECGSLTVIRPLNLSFEPHRCPGCGELAARAMLTVPAFAALPPASLPVPGASRVDEHPAVVIAALNNVRAFPCKRPWMVST
jgi:putative FmdB family regulatory protein